MSTRGITLIHTSGEKDSYKTILTEQEFCAILTEMRDNYDKRDKKLDGAEEITHGLNDDIVSFENSLRFAKEQSGTTLRLVSDDHRLSASHQFLEYQFKRFLEEIIAQ